MRRRSLLASAASWVLAISAPLWAASKTVESFGRVPLSFEESQPGARQPFIARGLDYGIQIGPAAAEIHVVGGRPDRTSPVQRAVFTVAFAGADPNAAIETGDPQPGVSHYFSGADPKQWRTGVRHYGRLTARSVYPGIDVVYYGNQRTLEYDLVLSAGADPRSIRLRFDGISALKFNSAGDLVLVTAAGEVMQKKPVIYQESDGRRREVDGRYVRRGALEVGFEVAAYDPRSALVIDPVLVYSTYRGGTGTDIANSIAVDTAGFAYITGTTLDPPDYATETVFVTKFSPAGNSVVYSSFIRGAANSAGDGPGSSGGNAIAVDSGGNAYVAGYTTAVTFPIQNAFQSSLGGATDGFILKLAPDGSRLMFSSYLGASSRDWINAIALDPAGNAYVTGVTYSGNFPLSTCLVGMSCLYNPNGAAFVAKIVGDGSAMAFSMRLCGDKEEGLGIAVDPAGNSYVTGSVSSCQWPPVPVLGTANAGKSAFVAKFDSAGTPAYYRLIGGSGDDIGKAIAVDTAGNAFIAGRTSSTDFPVAHAQQPASLLASPQSDAFVTKLSADGTTLIYSTYLGGAALSEANGIAVDSAGNAYVGGMTDSAARFPQIDPVPSIEKWLVPAQQRAAFVVAYDPAGALVLATFIGPVSDHTSGALALDSARSIYVTGTTNSSDFPLVNAYQASLASASGSAFVSKIQLADPAVRPLSVTPNSGGGATQTFAFRFTDDLGRSDLTSVGVMFRNSGGSVNAMYMMCTLGYDVTANLLSMREFDGTVTTGAPGVPGVLASRGCSVDRGSATVAWSGNVLTLTATITFADMYDEQQVWLSAKGATTEAAWLQKGAWTLAAKQLGALWMNPCCGSGQTGSFEIRYVDKLGISRLRKLWLWFTAPVSNPATASTAGTCLAYYDAIANRLYLRDDAGTSWLPPDYSGHNRNSQCSFDGLGGGVGPFPGEVASLFFRVSFGSSFFGRKQVWAAASEWETESGWQPVGDWTIVAPLRFVSLTPPNGSGFAGTLKATFADDNMAMNGGSLLISPDGSTANACYIKWDAFDQFYLAQDNGVNWSDPAHGGTPNTLSNGQCFFELSQSSIVKAALRTTVQVGVSFRTSFTGSKKVLVSGSSPAFSIALQPVGSWTVPPPPPIEVKGVSVTPGSGSGYEQIFQAAYSDSFGYRDFDSISLLINPTGQTANACYLRYDLRANVVYLAMDDGIHWLAGPDGYPAIYLENSQCEILSRPGVLPSGANALVWTASIRFKAPLRGNQKIYLAASGSTTNAAWQPFGTWFVPNPPQNVSVTPNAGNGSKQTFAFRFTSEAGIAQLSDLTMWFRPPGYTGIGGNSCRVQYVIGYNQLNLTLDSDYAGVGGAPGDVTVLSNSRCSLDLSRSTAVLAGLDATITLAMSFTSMANGPQEIWMRAAGPGYYADTTLQRMGTWAVEIPPPQSLRFVPLSPCRVVDTRGPAGFFGGPKLADGETRALILSSGSCGVPATAQAYSLNVAVVPAGPLGYLTLWPSGQPKPVASTLNSLDGRVKSNTAIVPAGAGGAVSVFASNATHLILDIDGYFVPATDATALAFYPVAPCRVADTRSGASISGGQTRSFPVASAGGCKIPASAQAYSLNLAVIPKGPLGYLTAWAGGQPQPAVASLNAPTGTVTANAVIVPAGSGGDINVFATNPTDLVIDINGYFAPPGTGGLSLYNVTPCRVLDSRQPSGAPAFSSKRDVGVAGGACAIPAAAEAYVFGATVVPGGALGYLTLWPQGQAQPTVSTLNALDAAVTSNMAIVPAAAGAISAFPSNPAHLILDIFGYFAQ